MTTERKICCVIMLCQMTAILSGVSLLYLAVIVVIPSKNELEAGFFSQPIMCTTVKAEDIVAGGKKAKCEWTTCSEWCLSKGSGTCMQIYVMARSNGSQVTFRDCYDINITQCSALDVNLTYSYKCKKGECRELTGLFYCIKDGDNVCRDISPAYECRGGIIDKGNTVLCDENKCEERLNGVYACQSGMCNKLLNVKHYWNDCQRKCTDLQMRDRNVIIFTKEKIIATDCRGVNSPDNNTISEVDKNDRWKVHKRDVIFLFCTYVKKTKGNKAYDLIASDCFNATLGNASRLETLRDYLHILEYSRELYNRSEWLVGPEHDLRLMNNTQLRINNDGCVNTLAKECKAFIKTHATDGRDGITPDRFPCFYSNKITDYVLGKYNPDLIRLFLILSSALPFTLFIFSCTCLFVCSKTVGVDDEGHLKINLLQTSQGPATKESVQFDELL